MEPQGSVLARGFSGPGGLIQDRVIPGEPLKGPEIQALGGLGLEDRVRAGGSYGFNRHKFHVITCQLHSLKWHLV